MSISVLRIEFFPAVCRYLFPHDIVNLRRVCKAFLMGVEERDVTHCLGVRAARGAFTFTFTFTFTRSADQHRAFEHAHAALKRQGAGFVGAIVGAIIVLLVWGYLARRRGATPPP